MLGACEALVSAIRNHRTHDVVVERACQAISVLAKLHGNAGWFGATGCLEALLAAQNVHVDNSFVQAAVWLALANLCIDENNRTKLVSSGACERVVLSLEKHIQDRSLAHSVALAVDRLCEAKDEPFQGVAKLERGESAVQIESEVPVKKPSEPAAVTPRSNMYPEKAQVDDAGNGEQVVDNAEDLEEDEFASDAGAISKSSSNAKLSSFPSAASVVENPYEEISLEQPDAAVQTSVPPLDVAAATSMTVATSIMDDTEDASSEMFISPRTVESQPSMSDGDVIVYVRSPDSAKGKFFASRCHDILVRALEEHCADEKAASQLCRTIAKLCQGHGGAKQPERVAFGRAFGPAVVVKALQQHPASEVATRWACTALTEIIRENKRNKTVVRNQGACELLVQALRKHRHSATGHITVESACLAIYHLCLHNYPTKEIFSRVGAVEGLLETLELHQKTLDTTYACCIALHQVCMGNMSNINALSVSGAASILSTVAQKYADVKNVVTAAVSIMVLTSCAKNMVGQTTLSATTVIRQIPTLLARYEKLDSLATSLCAAVTLLTHKNSKNQAQLGQGGLIKGMFCIVEKLLGIIWDDLQGQINQKRSPTLTLRSVVSRSEASLSGKSRDADSETGDAASQLDIFSPSFIHPSITGIVLHRREYDVSERTQTNEAAVLLEESLRALGNLVIDNDLNKSKLLAAHANILEVLRPVAFYNAGLAAEVTSAGEQNVAMNRLAKLVHVIFLQLTIHA